MTEKRQAPEDARFAGKTFVFTGALARRSRDEAAAEVLRHGGKVSGSVSKLTDYVVVGADPGSKHDKARSLGVTILHEDDFDKLLSGKWKSHGNRANRQRIRQNRKRAGARRRIRTRAKGGGRNRSPRRRRNDPCSEDPSGTVASKGKLSFPPSKWCFRLDIRVKNTRTSTTKI